MFSYAGGEGSEGPKYTAVYDFGTSYPELAGNASIFHSLICNLLKRKKLISRKTLLTAFFPCIVLLKDFPTNLMKLKLMLTNQLKYSKIVVAISHNI